MREWVNAWEVDARWTEWITRPFAPSHIRPFETFSCNPQCQRRQMETVDLRAPLVALGNRLWRRERAGADDVAGGERRRAGLAGDRARQLGETEQRTAQSVLAGALVDKNAILRQAQRERRELPGDRLAIAGQRHRLADDEPDMESERG